MSSEEKKSVGTQITQMGAQMTQMNPALPPRSSSVSSVPHLCYLCANAFLYPHFSCVALELYDAEPTLLG
jgi:hypothetical protein